MSASRRWSIADLIDFEFLLGSNPGQSEPAIDATGSRREVFRRWVDARRAAGKDLPGTYFQAAWQLLLVSAVGAGLVLGGSLAAGLLAYRGFEPLNAIGFLAWTLGPQLAMLLLVLALGVIRRTTGLFAEWKPLRLLLQSLVMSGAALLGRMPGEKRQAITLLFERLREQRERYADLAGWPMLVITQSFAVCFNLGILAVVLAQLPMRELRFGWQTTPEFSARGMAEVVSAVSTPWKWAPNPHPTPEEVSASRFEPGQSHATLSGPALRSWWPFLCYCVAAYGLVPRLMLLGFAGLKLRRELDRVRFDSPAANALWRRLTGPLIAAGPTHPASVPEQTSTPATHPTTGRVVVLIDQSGAVDEARLRDHLATAYRWELATVLPVRIDNRHQSASALGELRSQGLAAVVVPVPVERDPIVAIGLFLQEVCAAVGEGTEVLVLLLGPPNEERLKHWQYLKARHGIPLGIESWEVT